jgi:hypothetical protein
MSSINRLLLDFRTSRSRTHDRAIAALSFTAEAVILARAVIDPELSNRILELAEQRLV